MSTLMVGEGQQFTTISAAVAAARDGDVINVQAGTYYNDFVVINKAITIQGVGGMVHLAATQSPPNGKGIFVTSADVMLNNLSFSGATVPDGNGAGIRYEAGNLTINNSYFHNNQNGLLAAAHPTGRITINNSEFSHNGTSDGYTHNLYVNQIDTLTITNSYFHNAVAGHQIKSRASNTIITDSRIFDGPSGTASYSVDLPNGGRAVLRGNVIQQGPQSENPAIVHFGGEGGLHANSSLEISNNIVVNQLSSPSAKLLVNQTSIAASISVTSVHGLTLRQMASGPANVTQTTTLDSEPTLDTSAPWQQAPTPPPGDTTQLPPSDPAVGSVVVGSGSDTLGLKISQDAYDGDAQFTVSVDGQQVSGILTAHALHSPGQSAIATVKGNWEAGSQIVSIAFLNNSRGGTAAPDRNLYIDGLTFNGTAVASSSASFYRTGAARFTVDDNIPIPEVVPKPSTITKAASYMLRNGEANLSGTGNDRANSRSSKDGNDTLHGSAANDLLSGSSGADADIFQLRAASQNPVGAGKRDVILDVSHAQGDKIDLSETDANTKATGNPAFTFLGDGVFISTAGHLHAITLSDVLVVKGDVNGDWVANFQVEAQGAGALQASDFIL